MSIFWWCLFGVIGSCGFSLLLGDDPSRFELFLGIGVGVVLAIDSKLSDIKNQVDGLDSFLSRTKRELKEELSEIKSEISDIESCNYSNY